MELMIRHIYEETGWAQKRMEVLFVSSTCLHHPQLAMFHFYLHNYTLKVSIWKVQTGVSLVPGKMMLGSCCFFNRPTSVRKKNMNFPAIQNYSVG